MGLAMTKGNAARFTAVSASALAAVPVPTKNTDTSRSKISEKVRSTFRSRSLLP
jgi:hypothetical protein